MKIKYLLITAVLTTAILCSGSIASAQTTDTQALIAQLQAQIASLMAQLQALQAQQGTASAWCHTFNTNLGYSNSGTAEVGYLHTALGKEGISYSPDTGNVYGLGTRNAVGNFQLQYGLFTNTDYYFGYTEASTITKLNALYGCGTPTLPAGCSSASGYSLTTGQDCSCTSTSGYSLNTGASCGSTLPQGCTSTSGYSLTTGQACDGSSTPPLTYPSGCTSTSGYSLTTGLSCACSSASGYNSITGASCGSTLPVGCSSTLGYSSTTGQDCSCTSNSGYSLNTGALCGPNNSNITINSVSGPSSLAVGQTGTWQINATVPANAQVSYFADWGDTPVTAISQKEVKQNIASFTHIYFQPGTYTATFSLNSSVNFGDSKSAQTSITVVVGGSSAQIACSSFPCYFDGKAITNTWGTVDGPPSSVSAQYPYEFNLNTSTNVQMTLRSDVWPSNADGHKNTMYVELDNKIVFQESKSHEQAEADEQSNNVIDVIQLGQLSAGKHYIKIYAFPDPNHFDFDWFKLDPVPPVVCTQDMYTCPNGFSVSRTGPNCEFICPNTGCTSTSGYNSITGAPCGSTLPEGCTSTSGYSLTTGLACDGSTYTPPVSTCTTSGYDSSTGFRCGCTSTSGWSSTTGLACDGSTYTPPVSTCTTSGYDSSTGFRCGCTSTSGYSSTTGEYCGTTPTYPSGCTSTQGYSSTTGQSCGNGI